MLENGYVATLIFSMAGMAVIAIALVVLSRVGSFKLLAEIERENVAVNIAAAGFLVGMAIPISTALRVKSDLVSAVLYSLMSVALEALGYALFEVLTPHWALGQSLRDGKWKGAILVAGIFIATGVIISGAIS